MIDSQKVSEAIHALEQYREECKLTSELRGDSLAICEILAQEQAIQAMLPDNWSITYDYPFYCINLFRS